MTVQMTCTDLTDLIDLPPPVRFATKTTSLTLIPHPDESFSGGFEGPEKLLEIWFAENPTESGLGLKSIPRQDWEDMLTKVGCKVLSVVKSAGVDAYLLRYSLSLFLFRADELVNHLCLYSHTS
jgi:Adenosylmethionine decarboxylase